MSRALADHLLNDPRARGLRRSERALLALLARRAGDDGRLSWPTGTKNLAAAIDYSREQTKLARRQLAALELIAYVPGRGSVRSRYAVALSWDRPARLDVTAAAGRSLGTEAPEPAPDVPAHESRSGATVLQLHAAPVDDAGWCAAARAAGRIHKGRRCCGDSPRQHAERERHAQREQDRAAELARVAELTSRPAEGPAQLSEQARAELRAQLRRAQRTIGGTP